MSSFPYRDETRELNDTTRKAAGGSYIQLSDGITHYQLSNHNNDETAVLVHGFSVPSFIFDPTFEFLTRSGFRTLRYDLFGRGFSDRPHTRYNIDLFNKQLLELLDTLRITSPVNLLGLSMGGPIAGTFTARHPERIRTLTLIDPSGASPVALTTMLRLAKMPILAEAVLSLMGSEAMVRAVSKDLYDPELVDQFINKVRVQMQYKGYNRALLSSVRNNMLDTFVNAYQRVGEMDLPVQLIWGREDKAVPLEHNQDLRTIMPNAEVHIIENCGHIPHYEKPEEVNPILLNFLRSQ